MPENKTKSDLCHVDLFSGIGGFALAARWAGIKTVQFVEIDPFCHKVLNKNFPGVPIHNDIKTFKYSGASPFILTAGFPCQDISVAGFQAGIEAERSGLWSECCRVVGEARPKFAVMENVPNLLSGGCGDWFGKVLRDLAAVGYDAEWHCLPASYLGAFHRRDRVWIIAYPVGANVEGMDIQKSLFSYSQESCRWEFTRAINEALPADDYARMRGNYDGVPVVMDRLKALGNAIVPQVAYQFMETILEVEHEK